MVGFTGVVAAVAVCLVLLAGEARSSDVIELTPSNFESLVLNSDDPWIVEFFGSFDNVDTHRGTGWTCYTLGRWNTAL